MSCQNELSIVCKTKIYKFRQGGVCGEKLIKCRKCQYFYRHLLAIVLKQEEEEQQQQQIHKNKQATF